MGRSRDESHSVGVGSRESPPVWRITMASDGGRYWVRTSDLLGVNEALYH